VPEIPIPILDLSEDLLELCCPSDTVEEPKGSGNRGRDVKSFGGAQECNAIRRDSANERIMLVAGSCGVRRHYTDHAAKRAETGRT